MANITLRTATFKKWVRATLYNANAGYAHAELLEVVENVIERFTKNSVAKLFENMRDDILRLKVGVFTNFEDFSKSLPLFIKEIKKLEGVYCKRKNDVWYIIADANSGELYGSIKLEMVPAKGGSVPVLTMYLLPDAGNYCY